MDVHTTASQWKQSQSSTGTKIGTDVECAKRSIYASTSPTSIATKVAHACLTLGTHYCSHACRSLKDLDRVTVVIVIKALVRAESSVFIVEKVYRVSKVKSIQVVISSPVQMSLLFKWANTVFIKLPLYFDITGTVFRISAGLKFHQWSQKFVVTLF